jgi:cysteinyl-tRNA synthetase
MVAMIQTLIDKGHAYVAEGREGQRGAVRGLSSMPDYGKLSNRRLDEQQAGARIAVEDHKKQPGRLRLVEGIGRRRARLGRRLHRERETLTIHGRPGWHIECSVMSEHHLARPSTSMAAGST